MIYALRFLPQVETDVLNGRTWYEGKGTRVRHHFKL
jgi:hypothetical protein